MEFSVRVTDYQKNVMLNMCDADLIGKDVIDGELKMHISENYYGHDKVDKNEAASLLKSASILNLVGKETISLSIDLELVLNQELKLFQKYLF